MDRLQQGMLLEVLRSIDEGIHVVDVDGITVFYNEQAAALDGLSREEVTGVHVLEVFPSLTPKTSTLIKVLETGKPIYNQQQAYANRHGERIVTVNTTLPLVVEGRLVGALEVAKDVTRIQELSERLIDLEQRVGAGVRKSPVQGQELYRFDQIITQDPAMEREILRARRATATRSPVLVVGETGTGKELVVQSIHSGSPRKGQPFIAQNCAAIPASLLEGVLFGTAKGAFTGAEDRPGLFELAAGGTLFLDEIHTMPVELQAKLLRVLEDQMVRRVGDVRLRPVDVRILAATNEDPVVSLKEGRLRKDLFYRLHVVRIQLPPLRERPGDIPLLTRHFIRKLNYQFGTLVTDVSPEVADRFQRYAWPGNVRELEHAIEGAMNQVEGDRIEMEHLPPHLDEDRSLAKPGEAEMPLPLWLESMEREAIRQALAATSGNVRQAACRLGIPRQTLQYKLKKWEMR
ncbi:sigma-54 interaction domain-containing protein [Desmospora profundinema]|uniref:Arginine utilization regulatory protein n=1 Tax=Desmospora profundinema TaxID=1571184 RepID=A0ABU1IKX6_9BACL|nr:sigma 54-interacting transcriptional regulator [Desmospora profundinema]MDR6225436.1 arginine utilization regulatory protein [Desmospora profundinema]